MALIKEEIYYSLVCQGPFPEEQRGFSKEKRGEYHLLYIDEQDKKCNHKFISAVVYIWETNLFR